MTAASTRIPLTRPLLDPADVLDDIAAVLASGTLTRGPWVARFEQEVAARSGVAHAVATTSATTALHLALVAAGIGPGDEVLVSDFTFPATGNVIAQCGAVPVLIDCLPGSFHIDLSAAAAAVTDRTRALLVVDPFGQPTDLAAASRLAQAHGLFLLEDAACAIGAERDGRPAGGWPGAGCFSFHPRKVITTGEGGMVTTDDGELASRLRLLLSHGGAPGDIGLDFVVHGFNYRLSEIQAVLGVAQMARLDENVEGRGAAGRHYAKLLAGVEGVSLPLGDVPEAGTFQSFVVLLDDGVDRAAVVAALRERGVESTLGTYAMHAQPAFARYGYRPGDLPNSLRAQRQSLTLPLWPGMDRSIVEQVVEALVAVLVR